MATPMARAILKVIGKPIMIEEDQAVDLKSIGLTALGDGDSVKLIWHIDRRGLIHSAYLEINANSREPFMLSPQTLQYYVEIVQDAMKRTDMEVVDWEKTLSFWGPDNPYTIDDPNSPEHRERALHAAQAQMQTLNERIEAEQQQLSAARSGTRQGAATGGSKGTELDSELVFLLESEELGAMVPTLKKAEITTVNAFRGHTIDELEASFQRRGVKGKTYTFSAYERRQLVKLGLQQAQHAPAGDQPPPPQQQAEPATSYDKGRARGEKVHFLIDVNSGPLFTST